MKKFFKRMRRRSSKGNGRQGPKTPADKSPENKQPADVEAGLKAATRHYRAGRLAPAEEACRTVLRAAPEHSDALLLMGGIATRQGNHGLAAECFKGAVAVDPTDAAAHSNLGSALRNQGNTDEAIACFRRATEIDPNLVETHNNLGHALGSQGKLDEAIACFRRALEIDATYASGHTNLGHALRAQEKPDEAAACYQRAIEINPEYAEPRYYLGGILKDKNMLDGAAACYRRVIEIDPDNAKAHNELGNTLNDQERPDEAAACFRRAIEINPTYAEPHNNLGIAMNNQNRVDEAVACYHRAIGINPDYAEAYNNLGNALKDQDKADEAIASYRRATEIRPGFAEAYCNLAKIYTFTPGDAEIEKLKELLAREDMSEENRVHLLYALGKAHDDIGDYDEAFSHYRQANADMAKQVHYDASEHRNGIKEVKKAFPKPPAAGDPGDGGRVPVFVLGMSRSGKTLTESLLTQYEDVYGAGESRAWTGAMATVLRRNGVTEPFPANAASMTGEHMREMGRLYMEEVSRLSPESGFLVDTMPGNYPYVGLICQALPAAKIIYCHRDALDHCLFVYFQRYRARHSYSYDLRNVAAYYADYQDVMAHWRKLHGDRVLSLKYEDTVADPAEAAALIYAFLGLESDPGTVRADFTTDEIGHWKNYEAHLGPLRQALGKRAR